MVAPCIKAPPIVISNNSSGFRPRRFHHTSAATGASMKANGSLSELETTARISKERQPHVLAGAETNTRNASSARYHRALVMFEWVSEVCGSDRQRNAKSIR